MRLVFLCQTYASVLSLQCPRGKHPLNCKQRRCAEPSNFDSMHSLPFHLPSAAKHLTSWWAPFRLIFFGQSDANVLSLQCPRGKHPLNCKQRRCDEPSNFDSMHSLPLHLPSAAKHLNPWWAPFRLVFFCESDASVLSLQCPRGKNPLNCKQR